jgi:hypothetical protein
MLNSYRDIYELNNILNNVKTENVIERRVLKGGSFLDMRDGVIYNEKFGPKEDEKESLKIRISARLGRTKKYSAQNVGFRCAQSIEENEEDFIPFKDDETHRVYKLRAPIHHHIDERLSHPIHKEEL